MSETEREPDQTDDPRKAETGQGYQEENPAGGAPGGPSSGTSEQADRAPDPSGGQDEKPSNATGNPGAAGG